MASSKISGMGFLNKGKREAEAKQILAAFSEASMDLEGCLQQPLEDTTIVGQLTQLRSYIESHTLKFYHSGPLGMIANDIKARFEDEIRRNFQNNTSALMSTLVECESRMIAIRSTIAHILFASIDFTGDFKRTLLPPRTVSLLSSFKLEARSTAESYENQVKHIAMSRWRVLSNFLLLPADSEVSDYGTKSKAFQLTNSIDVILAPLVDDRYVTGIGREERYRSLSSIVQRAAKIGNTLFAQPSTWEFRWDLPAERTATEQCTVVYPAIWKTGDNNGRKLDKPILKQAAEMDFLRGTGSRAASTSNENTANLPPPEVVPSNVRNKPLGEDKDGGQTSLKDQPRAVQIECLRAVGEHASLVERTNSHRDPSSHEAILGDIRDDSSLTPGPEKALTEFPKSTPKTERSKPQSELKNKSASKSETSNLNAPSIRAE